MKGVQRQTETGREGLWVKYYFDEINEEQNLTQDNEKKKQ